MAALERGQEELILRPDDYEAIRNRTEQQGLVWFCWWHRLISVSTVAVALLGLKATLMYSLPGCTPRP